MAYKHSLEAFNRTLKDLNLDDRFFGSALVLLSGNLKIGSPIILLRNISAPRFCNGMRYVIKKIMGNVIEVTIFNGKSREDNVLLPRIPMISTNATIQFKRLQFPIRLVSAMSIQKSQG